MTESAAAGESAIDCHNAITVKRAVGWRNPRSFYEALPVAVKELQLVAMAEQNFLTKVIPVVIWISRLWRKPNDGW